MGELAHRRVWPVTTGAIWPGSPTHTTWGANAPSGAEVGVGGLPRHTFRVDGKPWSMIGWSTGAFCSAKLLLHHPDRYAAAAGLGGYYDTLTDHTTGNLFGSRVAVKKHNSPLWLYQHGGFHSRRLLVVTGRQDHESYRPSERFLAATRSDPAVSSLVFPSGGHNYHNYRILLPAVLQWLNKIQAIA